MADIGVWPVLHARCNSGTEEVWTPWLEHSGNRPNRLMSFSLLVYVPYEKVSILFS